MSHNINWNEYLYTLPSKDYVNDNRTLEEKLEMVSSFMKDADAVLIGAGAGLSSAAGLTYSGERFKRLFPDFIEKYGLTDMYSSTFYPFKTEEEKWAYWCRHVMANRITPPALDVYKELKKLVGKEYFVLTTNVDHQFWKADFKDEKIFATQGDYGLMQCAHACHNDTYDDTKLFQQMAQAMKDCTVPKYMIPRCPVCGGPMEINLRKDQYFVEDEHWHEAADNYAEFLKEMHNRKLVLLELGVGFNTPMIIRFPFEHFIDKEKKWSLIRLNMGQAFISEHQSGRSVGIDGDIADSIRAIEKVVL